MLTLPVLGLLSVVVANKGACDLECGGFLRSWPTLEWGFNEGPKSCEFCVCVGNVLKCLPVRNPNCVPRQCPVPLEPAPYCRRDVMCGPHKECPKDRMCVLSNVGGTLGCCRQRIRPDVGDVCKTPLYDISDTCPTQTVCKPDLKGVHRCAATKCYERLPCTDGQCQKDHTCQQDDVCPDMNCRSCCIETRICTSSSDCTDSFCKLHATAGQCTTSGTCTAYAAIGDACRHHGVACQQVLCKPPFKCIDGTCANSEVCCAAAPQCREGYFEDRCTKEEEASGVCQVRTMCCNTITCRKEECSYEGKVYQHAEVIRLPGCRACACYHGSIDCVEGCAEDEMCANEIDTTGECSDTKVCKPYAKESEACIESGLLCERKICGPELTCVAHEEASNVGSCVADVVCCQAYPRCGRYVQDSTCSQTELASGACVVATECCKTITCRQKSCDYEGQEYPGGASFSAGCSMCTCTNGMINCDGCTERQTCKVSVDADGSCNQETRSCVTKSAVDEPCRVAGGDECLIQPCQEGLTCVVTEPRTLDGICKADVICCGTPPACPDDGPPRPCTQMEIDAGDCRIVSSCCEAITCPRG